MRDKDEVMLQDIMKFRGKDEAHTIRAINKLVLYGFLKRGKRVGRQRIIKSTRRAKKLFD
ncbi:MAG: hypothetical protein GWN01_01405 [Nitrosopumilaceae archaeon]|nr:hypothetical protein [Nitrosopumilaceae archaeon]NIU86015.1 hypothetical protein [Nitrosopumilaceae archaeon]NIX60234.1 hypothetical protein [Nitrosopumilaceae archaeon]